MSKLLRKRIIYPILGTIAVVFSFVLFFINSPNAYADTEYSYGVEEIKFKTASSDGYFTCSKAFGSYSGTKMDWSLAPNSSISFTFAPTNKIITSASSFSFYGEYAIDDYGNYAALPVTYAYSFGSVSGETTVSESYTYSIDSNQLAAEKPSSITFTISIATETQYNYIRADGNFVFNAKDANVDINFDTQGGSGGTSSIKATPGSAMPAITLPTKTGYSFGGYYTGTNGSGTQYYTSTGASANNCPANGLTLYAKWTANTYTVNFDKQSGTGGSNSVTATYASAMPAMTKPTRTGYTFGGYYTGTNGGGTQ